MKPVCVYCRSSIPWIEHLLSQTDLLDFREVYSAGAVSECPEVAFFRIPPGLSDPVSLSAIRIEKAWRAKGARIINGQSWRIQHDSKERNYSILQNAGIRVPHFINCPTRGHILFALEAGALKYPFVVRDTDGCEGARTTIVRGESEIDSVLALHGGSGWRYMACEYINAKQQGVFWKWRPYIVGGRVDMWEAGVARKWIVNLAHNQDLDPVVFRAANEQSAWPRHWDAAMESTARVLGLEVGAFDVLADPSDRRKPVVVDVNMTYGMTADHLSGDLFPPDVKAIRKDHYRRVAQWLSATI